MKVIITGGKGYIGSKLVNAYQKEKMNVFIWTREGIKGNNYDKNYILLNESDVDKALCEIKPDLIIHCAGAPDVWKSINEPSFDLEGNYITTHNLLHGLHRVDLKTRVVILSSAAVYGNPLCLPITEDEKIKPLTPYALHKHFSELLCAYMHNNYDMDTKVVRIFSAFGPGIKKQILWDMYNKYKNHGIVNLFGNGSESRDYIYIDDAVDAIKLVADKASKDEIFFNIANGVEVSIKTVAETFCDEYGIPQSALAFSGDARIGDPANWVADIHKIKELGYSPKVTFKKGIKYYTNWLHELDKGDST